MLDNEKFCTLIPLLLGLDIATNVTIYKVLVDISNNWHPYDVNIFTNAARLAVQCHKGQ